MKTRQMVLLTLLMLSSIALANPIDKQQARQNVVTFLNKNNIRKSNSDLKLVHQQQVKKGIYENTENETAFYVFNLGDNDGFVITSGDDRTNLVLGYTDKGSFDPDRMPDNMKSWLDGCVEEMTWLKSQPDRMMAGANAKNTTRNRINPLLKSEWNQNNPYNLLCPSYSTGKYSPTGCVAAAMAQIMYYYKWPAKTTELIEGYTNRTRMNSKTFVLKDIPAGTSIHWDDMKTSYLSSETDLSDPAVKAVAELLLYCGTSVKMNYGISESSASTSLAGLMLKQKFDYRADLKEIVRSRYSLNKWLEIIYNELKEGRPVLYSGDTYTSGHAFIVDGYNGDELFHINWGWGGFCDGYFLLTVANPYSTDGTGASSSKDGYSSGQSALINIQPNDGMVVEGEPLALTFRGTSTNGNTITFSSVGNYSGTDGSFEYTIATMNDDESLTPISRIKTVENLYDGWYYSNVSFTVSGLPDGKYKIVPVSRQLGSDKWIYKIYGATEEYVEAVIEGNNTTLSVYSPSYSLEAYDFDFTGSLEANDLQPVNVTIKNLGDEYYGGIYLFASKTNSKGDAIGPFGVTVTKDGALETTLFFTPPSAGTYHLWVTMDKNGEQVIGQSDVVIKTGSGSSSTTNNLNLTLTPIINNLDKEGKVILGNTAEITIKVENPTSSNYAGYIGFRLYCFRPNGYWTWVSRTSYKEVGAGKTAFVNINMTIDPKYLDSAYKDYAVVPVYNKGGNYVETDGYLDVRFTIMPAITYYTVDGMRKLDVARESFTVDGEVAAVDLRGNTTTKNILSNHPNCLYFTDDQTNPLIGVENNIVNDGVAENICLTDGYPFFSPLDFTAKKMSYTRVFDKGYKKDGSGWSTIALPFDVEKVTLNDQGKVYDIDWFRSSDEKNKNFWVMEFISDNQEHVFFSHANKMTACQPYIIAVPEKDWGVAKDLTGVPITFSGENVTISGDLMAATSGDYYKMKGVFKTTPLDNVYAINDAGTLFVKGNAEIEPFRAYFMPTTTAPVTNALAINMDYLTEIDQINTGLTETDNGWFTLTGVKINKPTQSGLYIYNGKKIVVVK